MATVEHSEDVDLSKFPHYDNGTDALLGFLKHTKNTPTVGRTVFSFTCDAKSQADAESFVHRLRSTLSKKRKNVKNAGVELQKFTMQIVSIVLDSKREKALVTLGRSQKFQPVTDSFGFEMIDLLSRKGANNSHRWLAFIEALETEPILEVSAKSWDNVCIAVLAVMQSEAVFKGFNEETNSYVISRF